MKFITVAVIAGGLAISVCATEPEAKPNTPPLPARPETNVVIQIKGYGQFSQVYPAWPYVDTNGCAYLLPGEEFTIELEPKDDGSLKATWVQKRTPGKDAVTVKFRNDGGIAILTTQSHCSRIVTMKCRHRQAGSRKLFITGLNPVKPGMLSADSWPPEVVSLRLFDFKFWDDYDKAFEHER